ncbi:MAG: HAMP domain-containing sensor histidine kinase, partial [Eubacteriales bacterium]
MNFNIWKKTVAVGMVVGIIASIFTVLFTKWNYETYVIENNTAILSVVELLLEEQVVSKSEIVQAIQNSDDVDMELLEAYGYEVEDLFFLEQNESNLEQNIYRNLIVVDAFIILGMCVCYFLLKRREHKIDELICYLKQLQVRDYSLKIDGNEETELSKLQNEIYKITILLKEQAENSLQDKQQIKDNIVDISHQLKTPLTSMLIMTDNMLEYPDMDEETKQKFLENIRERIAHMEMLIQNLLKLSKFDANVIIFKKERIKAQHLIENAVEKNKALLDQKEIKLVIDCPESIEFMGDFHWQSEAISNIIKNAIEHSSAKDKVEISCTANHFATKICIRDYGQGIKKEQLKKIFTRYYKDSGSSESSLGVGLNLAKTIVEK